ALSDQLVDHGRDVFRLSGPERVGAAAVAMSPKIQNRGVISAADKIICQKEILSSESRAPKARSQENQLAGRATPPGIGDRDSVGGARTPMQDLRRRAHRCPGEEEDEGRGT